MADLDYARLISKSSTGVPTVPPSPSHDNGDWDENDIYEFEIYFDDATGKMYTLFGGSIVLLNPDPPVAGNTIYTGDDSIAGPRAVDLDAHTLAFLNGSQLKSTMLATPPIGEASFDWKAYGTTSTDLNHAFRNGAGSITAEMHGDGTTTFNNTLRIKVPTSLGSANAFTVENPSGPLFTINDNGFMNVFAPFQCYTYMSLTGSSSTWKWNDVGGGRLLFVNNALGDIQDIHSNQITHYLPSVFTTGYSVADASAQLEVRSVSKGFLPPRMTNAQMNAISSPAIGLMVYATDTVEGVYAYKSTGWTFIG